jgi:hypothetical protein
MASAGWTGVGLAAGAALATLGVDQLSYGVNHIKNRIEGRGLETGTFIQRSYPYMAKSCTGKEGSRLEKTLDYAYLGASITAACATGYVSVTRSIIAIKSTEPIHTVGHWVVNQRNFIEYQYHLSAGVSIYDAGIVVATETFDVTLSLISFFESPNNEEITIVEDVEYEK